MVAGNWEQTLRNSDGLEEGRSERVHKKKESKVFYQCLLSHLRIEIESEEKPQQIICYRAGDRTGRLDVEKMSGSDSLKLTSLLCWLSCFSGRPGGCVPR